MEMKIIRAKSAAENCFQKKSDNDATVLEGGVKFFVTVRRLHAVFLNHATVIPWTFMPWIFILYKFKAMNFHPVNISSRVKYIIFSNRE